MALRDRVERGFERWCDGNLRHPRTIIAASLFLVGVLATGLPRLEIETSFDSYLPRDNPAQELYEEFREEFGSGERVVILLRPEDLYNTVFLSELDRLHAAVEAELPFVDDVTSLVNARFLIGGPGTLASEGLLEEPVRDQAGLERLQRRIESNPLYENVIVSEDRTATAIVVELDGSLVEADELDAAFALDGFGEDIDANLAKSHGAMLTTEQSEELAEALAQVLERDSPSSARVFVAGTPLIAHQLGRMLTRDIILFVFVSVVLTALLLAVMFRNVWATIHPLLVVGLSVAGTLGWMGHMGIPLTAVTEVLPSLLVAVGVGDAVHIQSMFYRQRAKKEGVPAAIRWAMGHSGLAVLLTSLTTAASMASFQAAELQPIIDLGRAAPVGVALAFGLSVTLLPCLLSITPMDPVSSGEKGPGGSDALDRVLLGLGGLGTRWPATVLIATALLFAVAGTGLLVLGFSQDDLRWLPEDDGIRIATEELNRSMGGAEPFELYAVARDGVDLREPHILEALDELEQRVSELNVGEIEVAQSISLVDIVKETHKALDGSPDSELKLPDTRPAVSQEMLLFESAAPDDLERLVDTEWSRTRIAMNVPFVDALHYPRFAQAVVAIADDVLEKHGLSSQLDIRPTGLLMVAGATFQLLFVSMARSYAIAFGVITVLMLLLIGNLRTGLLSAIPNFAPIVLVLGMVGWAGAPLDISSMLVGGILIGVVVDDTIHFAHNFARYRKQTGCSFQAVRQTLVTTGRALLVTSTVLSIGFFSFAAASLENISDFGLYCGIGVVLAFLADVALLPALIVKAAPCAPECTCRKSWMKDEEGDSELGCPHCA